MFEEPGSPYYGQVKVPGGPKMPMGVGSEIVSLCGDADVVVEFAVEAPQSQLPPMAPPVPGGAVPPNEASGLTSPPPPIPPPMFMPPSKEARRVIRTTLEERWFRKVRGFNVPLTVTIDIATGEGLFSLLKRTGYPV